MAQREGKHVATPTKRSQGRTRTSVSSGSTPEFIRQRSSSRTAQEIAQHRSAPSKTIQRSNQARSGGSLRRFGVLLGIVAITGMLLLIAYVIVANTSAFTITSIDAQDSEHIRAADIARLANVAEGTTLLNVNEDEVRENLHKNPWVGEVEIIREFPDRLRVEITERSVEELVVLGSGGVVWCLGTGNVWIEPLDLSPADGQTIVDAALDAALQMGALLVVDVPVNINPKAGAEASDEELVAVQTFREQLSQEFLAQVVQVSAPGPESISCMLNSGVVVSLGAPSAISTKEVLVEQLLARYPNRLTYINVRVPSDPAYRMVGSEAVQEGTGVFGSGDGQSDSSDDAAISSDADAGSST